MKIRKPPESERAVAAPIGASFYIISR